MFPRRFGKYGNKKTVVDGITFDSKKEAAHYQHLCLLQKAGIVTSIELQPRFELQPGFKKDGKSIRKVEYVGDFRVTYNDGHQEVIDCKGIRTEAYLLKLKLLLFKYPDIVFHEA